MTRRERAPGPWPLPESGLAGWRRPASPPGSHHSSRNEKPPAWCGDPRGTKPTLALGAQGFRSPGGHRTPSCLLGCEQLWGAHGRWGPPHKSPNTPGPRGMGQPPQGQTTGQRPRRPESGRPGHKTGMHAPSLGLSRRLPWPHPLEPRSCCVQRAGWRSLSAGRPTHIPGPPGPRCAGK